MGGESKKLQFDYKSAENKKDLFSQVFGHLVVPVKEERHIRGIGFIKSLGDSVFDFLKVFGIVIIFPFLVFRSVLDLFTVRIIH